jgi:hypothetical protein
MDIGRGSMAAKKRKRITTTKHPRPNGESLRGSSGKRIPRPKQTDGKEEKIVALAEQGMSAVEIAAEVNVKSRAVHHVLERERIRREVEAKIDPATLSITAQQKFEAAIRQHKRQLDLQFEQRVLDECKRRLDELSLPAYAKEMAEYVDVIKSRKGHLTRVVFRNILACLNSATRLGVTDKRLDEAFVAFKKLELVLCNDKEAPTPNYSFPRTYAEMMARKREVSEARKARRASKGVPERR